MHKNNYNLGDTHNNMQYNTEQLILYFYGYS
jgi:hypothetical protein